MLPTPSRPGDLFQRRQAAPVRLRPVGDRQGHVRVRVGGGLGALPADRASPAALGRRDGADGRRRRQLWPGRDRRADHGRRQIGLDFSIADDAFVLSAQTTKDDLSDQLKLFAAKLAAPAWDPNPVLRAKAGVLSGYAGLSACARRDPVARSRNLLHSGDPRWGIPARATIEGITPAAFRKLWEPLLASGPIEISIFGDMDADATVEAVAATFGNAQAPRRAQAARPESPNSPPTSPSRWCARTPLAETDQGAAVIAWLTGGGSAGITESRKLEVLAAIFRDRLIDQLRSQAGISYSPSVASQWPVGMPTRARSSRSA